MTVTDSRLNVHEKEIVTAVEKSMPNGIHVQGLVKSYGLSPNTLEKYLTILENDHRLIYHEKIGNKDIYKIRQGDEMTHLESQEFVNMSISDIEKIIFDSFERAKKLTIAEQMEIYQQIVNVLLLTRYLKKFIEDVSGEDHLPENMITFFDKIDEITKKINQKVNIILSPLVMFPLIKSLDDSMSYLENINKGKRMNLSKNIKKIEPELNETLKKQYDELNRLEKKGYFDDLKSKEIQS